MDSLVVRGVMLISLKADFMLGYLSMSLLKIKSSRTMLWQGGEILTLVHLENEKNLGKLKRGVKRANKKQSKY